METGSAPPDHASTLSSRPRLHPQNGGVYQTLVWLSPGVRFFNLQLFGSLPKLESVNYMKPFQSHLWAVTLSFYIVTFRSHPCVLELPPPGTVSLCSKQPAPNYVSLIFCRRNVWPLLTAITVRVEHPGVCRRSDCFQFYSYLCSVFLKDSGALLSMYVMTGRLSSIQWGLIIYCPNRTPSKSWMSYL